MMDLMIELTNRCTLRCPTCFSHQDGRAKKNMSFTQFKGIIDQNSHLIRAISLYNYGEPFLNARLPEMVYYARKKGVAYVKVATNGMHLTSANIRKIIKSRLNHLSISLDGATAPTYEKFRVGGKFDRVVARTRDLVSARNAAGSQLKIEIQFIIMRHNEHEIPAIEDLARDMGVDFLRLKTVLVKRGVWKYLLPAALPYNRYRQVPAVNHCFKPVKELVVNCDGTVIPCCYIVEEDIQKFSVGNIFQNSLAEILSSEKYQNFVGKCTTRKSELSSCVDCQEGNLPLDYDLIKLSGNR